MPDIKRKRNPKAPRQIPPITPAVIRCGGWGEVTDGFSVEQARIEALRCLNCKDPKCVEACPLHIDIKAYIAKLVEDDFAGALEKICEQNPFPDICGRVCQHELYCEKACLLGTKLEPVAIGSLERFAADTALTPNGKAPLHAEGPRVALVGSGPASMIAAHDLAKKGYRVTIFEALHELGGVLAYGIPPFRLPREVLQRQIEKLRGAGVQFRTNVIVGKTITLQELFEDGYSAVFVGTGAGLPHLMNIEGENLTGVYTANEFLTRLNLMRAYQFPQSPTPVLVGERTVVVGGGNSAMDAARWARRLGSETTILFRRGRSEMRARLEEIEHAEEEGVRFEFLAAPVRLIGDSAGAVREMECIRMRLGKPDDSGRPAPVPIEGSEFRIAAETVVAAIGQSPNPTLSRATPQLITKRGKIVIDGAGETSMKRVFAGGDAVRGGSTVILAMSDGRAAAVAIDAALQKEAAGCCGEHEHGSAPSGNRILSKRFLTPEIASLRVEAPQIARKWRPGQFIIVQPDRDGERIPLTIVDRDAAGGSILLVVQAAGHTTRSIVAMEPGDLLYSMVGPLGEPATIESLGRVLCVGGGVGVAELLPVARAFREAGQSVTAICGARSADRIILHDALSQACDEVLWATDDGSFGYAGTVVDLMRHWRKSGAPAPALAHVIGPILMMSAVAELTREWGVRTFASLNPIMVDGTGMCGGCRVTVGGAARFACVEGPEFDAHQVDFQELLRRNRSYRKQEDVADNCVRPQRAAQNPWQAKAPAPPAAEPRGALKLLS